MVTDFCTYFDVGYLPRALALHESLRKHAPGSRLHAVCMDDESFETLTRLAVPDLLPIRRSDFEVGDTALVATQAARTVVEYYFTCTPSIVLYVLKKQPSIDVLYYVDADMFFFSSASAMFEDMGGDSVYIVEHGFPETNKSLERFGRFNVGILGFRNDAIAKKCLLKWREDCIEWCFDREEDGRFADQKYLDRWPENCERLKIARHPGVNVAPWNRENYCLSKAEGWPTVDGMPIVCFHFQGLRVYEHGVIELQAIDYGAALPLDWLNKVYAPYLSILRAAEEICCLQSRSLRIVKEPSLKILWRSRRRIAYVAQLGGGVLRLKGLFLCAFLTCMFLKRLSHGAPQPKVIGS